MESLHKWYEGSVALLHLKRQGRRGIGEEVAHFVTNILDQADECW